jgi:uncharacterized protein (TIGR02246 family)
MAATDEAAIARLLSEMTDAWNRGDVKAYGAHFQADGTFTNVHGTFHVGRDEFDRRHEEVFQGMFKGTTLALTPKKLRFIRPDVAIADIDVALSGHRAKPPGIWTDHDGALHTCLLLVLVRDDGAWSIAAYHNVWRAAGE